MGFNNIGYLEKDKQAADSAKLQGKQIGTNSGDVMAVGAFGIGSTTELENVDANNVIVTKPFFAGSACANRPFADKATDNGAHTLNIERINGVVSAQIGLSQKTNHFGWRTKSTNWQAWEEAVGVTLAQVLTNKSFGSHVLPSADNSINLGSSSLRFGTVYAGTGTINTSDAREKTSIAQFTENEISASIQLAQEIGTYQFLDSIETKGDSARVHIGMTVQRAIEIMEVHGLDPFRYGFICFDEWGDEFKEHPAEYEQIDIPAVLDEDGNEIEPAWYEQGNIIKEAWQEQTQKAGSRFGFRTDQLLMFIARGQEARIANIENRLKAF